jgi:hypothetical protein
MAIRQYRGAVFMSGGDHINVSQGMLKKVNQSLKV